MVVDLQNQLSAARPLAEEDLGAEDGGFLPMAMGRTKGLMKSVANQTFTLALGKFRKTNMKTLSKQKDEQKTNKKNLKKKTKKNTNS